MTLGGRGRKKGKNHLCTLLLPFTVCIYLHLATHLHWKGLIEHVQNTLNVQHAMHEKVWEDTELSLLLFGMTCHTHPQSDEL